MSELLKAYRALRRSPMRRSFLTIALAMLLLSGCLVDAEDDEPTSTSAVALPTATIPAIPPTATVELTPTMPPSLERLLDPGPTAPSPEQIIFQNGGDLWSIDASGESRQLTHGIEIGPWSQTVAGTLAAFVQERPNGDLITQEVRFIAIDGTTTGAVFGPVTVTGPDAEPSIVELAWSWSAGSLAMLRSNGKVEALIGLDDPFRDSSIPIELVPEDDSRSNRRIVWGPTGDGLALISTDADARNSLLLAPMDMTPLAVLADRTVADFVWLPGRGRIAFVEDSAVPGSRAPASIFTVVPDGRSLELLVSASRFAPAATIGGVVASPDGRELAFLLYAPDMLGQRRLDAMWLLHIDSGEFREIPIQPGYLATEMWFMAEGILWRGIDAGADSVEDSTGYTGVEPFILAFTDDEGNTRVLFQSTMTGEE